LILRPRIGFLPYVSTQKPTKKLVALFTFIITFYTPLWFMIRKNPSISEGSRYLFQAIQRSRYLAPKYRNVVHSSIQTNAFFAMPENLLLAMMTDSRPTVRKEALARLLTAREEEQNNLGGEVRVTLSLS
jgi:hypothetical protein